MSDFRHDPVFDQWVCIAESRQQRPVEFRQQVQRLPGLVCPFCPGNESMTPAPTLEEGTGGAGWQVRVFPNKYPALTPGGVEAGRGGPDGGQQEVIVVSHRHIVSFSELDETESRLALQVFRQRTRASLNHPGVRHVSLFMNCRSLAGASIEHIHFQLMGSPLCTAQVRDRAVRMGSGQPASVWGDEIRRETDEQIRVLEFTPDWLVFCPWASRFTGLIRFAARHDRPFVELADEPLFGLGRLLRKWTGAMEQTLDSPAYNLVFYFPPGDHGHAPWFVDLIPRFPQFAGFELATDCWVNPLSPELAASRFREAVG